MGLNSSDSWPINPQVGHRSQGERTERHSWRKEVTWVVKGKNKSPKREMERKNRKWPQGKETDTYKNIKSLFTSPARQDKHIQTVRYDTRVCPVRPTFSPQQFLWMSGWSGPNPLFETDIIPASSCANGFCPLSVLLNDNRLKEDELRTWFST